MTTQTLTEEAYEQGTYARRCRLSKMTNPYPPGSEQYRAWVAGWDERYQAEISGRAGPRFGPLQRRA
jgi:hypothetical protein